MAIEIREHEAGVHSTYQKTAWKKEFEKKYQNDDDDDGFWLDKKQE